MTKTQETWTRAHDLALIFVALAYGTDYKLSDEEMTSITSALQGWRETFSDQEVKEVVMEAIAVFMEEDAEQEVIRSMRSLQDNLSLKERQRALTEIVHIAEADGMLLNSERNMINVVSELWDVRDTGDRLLEQTTATVEEYPAWSVLHDIALLCIVLAHSTDNDLSEVEIAAILERLQDWAPELSEDDVRGILREALAVYAEQPDRETLQRSIEAVRHTLPLMQRLVLLDDLVYIAHADGAYDELEQELIAALAQMWDVKLGDEGERAAG